MVEIVGPLERIRPLFPCRAGGQAEGGARGPAAAPRAPGSPRRTPHS